MVSRQEEPTHYPFQCTKNPKRENISLIKITRKNFAIKIIEIFIFQDNPANDEGYYVCYLCGRWLLPMEITLDHVVPRSHATELTRFRQLRPCCYTCNVEKVVNH